MTDPGHDRQFQVWTLTYQLNIDINIDMTMVNIADAKARLSEYLELAAGGGEVVICRHNRPVARLVAVGHEPTARTTPRPVGRAEGLFQVPESFFDALPPEVEATFYPRIEGGGT